MFLQGGGKASRLAHYRGFEGARAGVLCLPMAAETSLEADATFCFERFSFVCPDLNHP